MKSKDKKDTTKSTAKRKSGPRTKARLVLGNETEAKSTVEAQVNTALTAAPVLKPLNPKQRAFCREYCKDHNGAQAAIRAGYSADSAAVIACELLIKPNIQAEIARLEAAVIKRNDISLDRVIKELAIIAFSDIANYTDIDAETGNIRALAFGDMPEGTSRALDSIEEDRTSRKSRDGQEEFISSKIKFKRADKVRALSELRDHFKIQAPQTTLVLGANDLKDPATAAKLIGNYQALLRSAGAGGNAKV